MIRLEMKNCNKYINREAAKTSALSFKKVDKHEYYRDEEIFPSDQIKTIEQAKLTYSH